MKIAYIVLKGMPLGGGIEKYTEEIGSRLAVRGHEIVVYTMRHYGADDGLYRGMNVKTVPTIRTRHLEKIIASFTATIGQCFEKNVDIVHFHHAGPALFCFIPKLLGRKVVAQSHGLEWKRSRWGLMEKLFLRLIEFPMVKLPHVFTAVSKVQQRYFRERFGREGIFVPTGTNPPQFEKPDLITQYGLQGDDYILFAGRLVREKGAHHLIEAYKRLKTDKKLVIAGDARYEEDYKSELYRFAEGDENIIFTGFVTGKMLNELFSNCYLFVLPSEVEGLPTVLLEAMSYGNCCLVSDIPENLEALDNYGYSFKSEDVNDFHKKLEYLLNNPEAVEAVKEKAGAHVLENYSWDIIASEFEKIYESLLRGNIPRGEGRTGGVGK